MINAQERAVPPLETVNRVRSILHEHGIFVREDTWKMTTGLLASVHIRIHQTNLFSAGKGISERHALASAYAELLERLQNLLLLRSNAKSGVQPLPDVLHNDGQRYALDFEAATIQSVLENACDETLLEDQAGLLKLFSETVHYPYYSAMDKSTVFLPYDILELACGSNGMAAGNTLTEAAIQAISEIFERHVLRSIYFNPSQKLPVIPDDYLMQLPVYKHISYLRNNGYQINVKDCTLGKNLPVAGVLIVRDSQGLFNLGSAPDLSIAIERCITELFQGFDLSILDEKLKPLFTTDSSRDRLSKVFSTREKQNEYEYFRALRSGTGTVPANVLDHSAAFDPSNIFRSSHCFSSTTLNHYFQILASNQSKLYLRDVSYLGFPAVHAYIPGMSETMTLTKEHLELWKHRVPSARPIFHNLMSASNDELGKLAETLEAMLEYPYVDYELMLPIIHNLYLTTQTALDTMDPENLITLIHMVTGNYTRAEEVVKAYLQRSLGCDDLHDLPGYAHDHLLLYRALQAYREHPNEADIRTQLERENFDAASIDEAIKIVLRPREVMGELDIPQCRDCSSCEAETYCSYPELLTLCSTVTDKISGHQYNQHKMACLFDEV
jgi:ribosomal protein S12 methylthiotransferase accessory factor